MWSKAIITKPQKIATGKYRGRSILLEDNHEGDDVENTISEYKEEKNTYNEIFTQSCIHFSYTNVYILHIYFRLICIYFEMLIYNPLEDKQPSLSSKKDV
jgi:hypothetical protein